MEPSPLPTEMPMLSYLSDQLAKRRHAKLVEAVWRGDEAEAQALLAFGSLDCRSRVDVWAKDGKYVSANPNRSERFFPGEIQDIQKALNQDYRSDSIGLMAFEAAMFTGQDTLAVDLWNAARTNRQPGVPHASVVAYDNRNPSALMVLARRGSPELIARLAPGISESEWDYRTFSMDDRNGQTAREALQARGVDLAAVNAPSAPRPGR